MDYLNNEQKEYCQQNQTASILKFVASRLILENVDEQTYLSIMKESFPDIENDYKTFYRHEVIPRLSLRDFESDVDFTSFIEATPLATLKINTFSDYRLSIGTAVNTKKDVTYLNEYFIQVVDGKFYDRIVTTFESEDGESTQINTKLKLSSSDFSASGLSKPFTTIVFTILDFPAPPLPNASGRYIIISFCLS